MEFTEQERIAKSKIIGRLGLLLFWVSFLALALTFYPVVKNEISYSLGWVGTKNDSEANSNGTPKKIVAADENFSIVIPKIGANAKVIDDVDPLNSYEYQQALSHGVAHAKNTPKPIDAIENDSGNTFLFAHSSDSFFTANQYNSIFYLLNKMEIADLFYIVQDKQIYKYSVTETKLISGDDVSYLQTLDNYSNPTATLMTCWPAGTTAKRLIVIGELQK